MSRKGKILIVEDNPAHRKLYTGIFARNDYKVIDVSTGAAAIKAIDDTANDVHYLLEDMNIEGDMPHSIDVILCDFKLPDMDAAQLLANVKGRFSDIKFMIYTASRERKEVMAEVKRVASVAHVDAFAYKLPEQKNKDYQSALQTIISKVPALIVERYDEIRSRFNLKQTA